MKGHKVREQCDAGKDWRGQPDDAENRMPALDEVDGASQGIKVP
jgi:hypothetical protein